MFKTDLFKKILHVFLIFFIAIVLVSGFIFLKSSSSPLGVDQNNVYTKILGVFGLHKKMKFEVPQELNVALKENNIDLGEQEISKTVIVEDNILFGKFVRFNNKDVVFERGGLKETMPTKASGFSYVCTDQEIRGNEVYILEKVKDIVFVDDLGSLTSILSEGSRIILGISLEGDVVNFIAGYNCHEK